MGKSSTNTSEKVFLNCNQCSFKTIHPYSFHSHKFTHLKEKPFECNKCEFSSKYEYNLNRHTKNKHGKKKSSNFTKGLKNANHKNSSPFPRRKKLFKPFSCCICDLSFKGNNSLNEHLATHTINKSVSKSCIFSNCRFRTRDAGTWNRHIGTHVDKGEDSSCGGMDDSKKDYCTKMKCKDEGGEIEEPGDSCGIEIIDLTEEKVRLSPEVELATNYEIGPLKIQAGNDTQNLQNGLSSKIKKESDLKKLFYCKICNYREEGNEFIALHNEEIHSIPAVVLELLPCPPPKTFLAEC